MESRLAGPVTGPMLKVWYAPDGSRLYASGSGKTFETQDFEKWDLTTNAPSPPTTFARQLALRPEPGAHYFAMSSGSQELWGVGRQLYHSDDNGKSWDTLTSYKSESVIGPGLHSVAVAPNDPNQIAVANENGVWRSMDGGLTWASMNQFLPNLPVQRILATPSGGRPARILTENSYVLELLPGSAYWRGVPSSQPQAEKDVKRAYSATLKAEITAFAASSNGLQVYAGSDDGRIWHSVDGGATFQPTQLASPANGHRVERLFVDPVNPLVALVAFSGDAPHVMRTFNNGNTWEQLDSASLPVAPAYAVTADRASGAVYVATEKGAYWTHFDLDVGGAVSNLTWTNLSEQLPQAKAVDVMLDPAGVQLYAAIEGYGVYGMPAPHRANGLQLVNSADDSTRAAAPGSLVSVVGPKVNAVSSAARSWPLWSSSQFQVPYDAVGPTVSVALETTAGRMIRDLPMQPVSPAIFVVDGVPMIFDADSGMLLDHNVAHPGQRLHVLVNGLGRVRPDWPAGMPAPKDNPPEVVAAVQAYLDRGQVPVARATLAPGLEYIGMDLVEIQLPVVANYGAMELHIAADGHESNHVQIVIAP